MFHAGFETPLTPELAEKLRARAHTSRGAVLTATTLAASGHPGGSMSSMELYTVLYSCARLRPEEPQWSGRDRIVVSHGHTSPGVYAALASAGFFDSGEFEAHFRQAGSLFEGHVERAVPGVEWSSGNLGQGLSAGVGMALAARMTGGSWRTYVAMSDGEQHKGQVAEARRLAVKERLTNLTVLVDLNGIQISGETAGVMPVPVADDFAADGWHVVEVDGHDVNQVYEALAGAVLDSSAPTCIIAHTVIGKGVSFMEGDPEFHGRGLKADEYERAITELGLESRLEEARARRSEPVRVAAADFAPKALQVGQGTPRTYDGVGPVSDNRSAWGNALVDLSAANPALPIAVLDCDLAVSVKTDGFAQSRPSGFIQCGVGEHNAATVAGALSVSGVLAFWAVFGVFGCDEAYNQQRLNDINGSALKLALTHCGLDVGEDGKTHQCLDYVGAFRDFFGWKVVVPADPNQTDRAVRALPGIPGNVCVAMGRSKLPAVRTTDGGLAFAGDYRFEYGRIDWVRRGESAVVLTMGTVSGAAVEAADALAASGTPVAVGVVSAPLDLDPEAMRACAAAPLLVTVEDHGVRTGLGGSVAEWLALNGVAVRFVRLGVEDYRSSGSAAALLAAEGLDAAGIERRIRELLG